MTHTRKPFVPSRQCPHRWCRPAHRWIGWVGLVLIVATFIENPIMEAVCFVFSMIVATALLTSRMGTGTHGRVAHQTAGADGSAETEVVVDHRWATIAAACDVVICAASVLELATIGSLGSGAYQQSHGIPPFLGWALIFAAAAITFVFYAHWRATRPRPKRRVRVWIRARIPMLATGR
jgi:hypothetical protein